MMALRRALFLIIFCCALSLPLKAQGTAAPLPARKAAPTQSAPSPLALNNSTIQRIRNRGNLMIAGVLFDYQPFGYLDAQGEVTGFEIDLIRALAEQWAIDVQFVPVTPSTRIQSLVAGQVDLVAAVLPYTTAAETLIDFSQSYVTNTPALLVRSDASTMALSALAGKTIAVIQGDEAAPQLQTALAAAATAVTIMPFHEYAPALLALKAGQADALLADSTYLRQAGDALPITNLLLPLSGFQTYGIGVAQGDAYFRNLVDASLSALQQNGVLATLYQKWFPDRQAPLLEQLPDQWPYTFADSPSELTIPPTSRLVQLQTRGKLLVGVAYDFAPFGFLGDDGQPHGFDIDLSHELARRWLGDANALELVRVTPETAIPLLLAGQVDLVAAALPLTWANRAVIDFSPSYFLDGQSVLTRAGSPMQGLADLDQKVVAVLGGAGSVNRLAPLLATAPTDAVAPIVLPFQELRSAQQALLAGRVDALIGSSIALSQTAQTYPGLTLAVDHFVRQPYAIGLPLFDAELRNQVNLTLQAMRADGTYTSLYDRWFATAEKASSAETLLPPPNDPANVRQTLIATPTPMPARITARSSLVLRPTPTPAAAVLIATGTTLPTDGAIKVTTTITATLAVALSVTIRPGLSVNARRAPIQTAPIVEVLAGGTTWPFLALSPDGAWIQLQLSGRIQAWVATQLVERPVAAATPSTPVPIMPTVTPTPITTAVTPTLTVTPRLLFTTPLIHQVNAADTLAKLAKQYYGNPALWHLIYAANRELIGDNPNAIPTGAELVIPPP